MKNNIPMIYWTFRSAWSLLHFIIVAAAAAALLTWALTDNHAVRALKPARDNVLDLQERVSNVIPWPWAVDDDGGGNNYDGGRNNYDGGGNNSQPERNAQSRSTTRIQVEGNVNVRVAPRLKARAVKVLDDGSSVESDCKIKGSRVKMGPHGPTSRWDHIPGLGYISDAYVPTITDGLPSCR